jgi:hypothetical protein
MNQPLKFTVYKRLVREKRWTEAQPIRDELMKEAKRNGLAKEAAQDWTYSELNKRFPPLNQAATECAATGEEPAPVQQLPLQPVEQKPAEQKVEQQGEVAIVQVSGEPTPASSLKSRAKDAELTVAGLSDIPDSWGDLPPNAPLSAEVSWVQANRLRCVRETSDRVIVDLSRALNPAPSYAALGWLETSIKTYAKFVDVAAKATASNEGEQAEIRREQQSIDEVRRMLEEMLTG